MTNTTRPNIRLTWKPGTQGALATLDDVYVAGTKLPGGFATDIIIDDRCVPVSRFAFLPVSNQYGEMDDSGPAGNCVADIKRDVAEQIYDTLICFNRWNAGEQVDGYTPPADRTPGDQPDVEVKRVAIVKRTKAAVRKTQKVKAANKEARDQVKRESRAAAQREFDKLYESAPMNVWVRRPDLLGGGSLGKFTPEVSAMTFHQRRALNIQHYPA